MSYQPTRFDRLPADRVLSKRGDVDPYVFSEDIIIAVDVALATNRPLLVSGNPGSGKSRLADAIAAVQGWNLLGKTMTSRTRLESLTASVLVELLSPPARPLHNAGASPLVSAEVMSGAAYLFRHHSQTVPDISSTP